MEIGVEDGETLTQNVDRWKEICVFNGLLKPNKKKKTFYLINLLDYYILLCFNSVSYLGTKNIFFLAVVLVNLSIIGV